MKSYWIWKNGEYEIFHYNMIHSRREEKGGAYPPLWKLPATENNIKLFREFSTDRDGYIKVNVNGDGRVVMDDKAYLPGTSIPVASGHHRIFVSVMKLDGLPAIYAESDVCPTDSSWYTLGENRERIPAGFDERYDSPEKNPEVFIFEYKKIMPVNTAAHGDGTLFDFGREYFGHICINGANADSELTVRYGESEEEALSEDALVFETVRGAKSYKLRQRAFRFIYINPADAEVFAEYEYLPLERRGSFTSDDERINRIWEMCAHTFHLNCREVLLDGIKRDRWCWCGDSYQCFKFNNYIFFDKGIVTRTLIGLGGSGIMCEHINTITDYTLYWILSLYNQYMSFGDAEFVARMYPRAVIMLDFMKTRENDEGFIEAKEGDWIFIDWSDIDKDGAVCAEQMLYIAANRAMAELARIAGEDGTKYREKADELTQMVNKHYWNGSAYIDSYTSGKRNVTRHANIFAVLYGIATDEQRESIIHSVLLNDSVTKITTPYFEGFELDVMGMIGNLGYIEDMLSSYWGGMLDLGATSVWEEFDPSLNGAEHYAMYNRPYGKSLCHAWGASPIYLLGKYYLGVVPTKPGYSQFKVKPCLGGFSHIKGDVPVNKGTVSVEMDRHTVKVCADVNGGTLEFGGKSYEIEKDSPLIIEY